jgi:hypothetical protein
MNFKLIIVFVSLHEELVAMVNVTCKSCNIVEFLKKIVPHSIIGAHLGALQPFF